MVHLHVFAFCETTRYQGGESAPNTDLPTNSQSINTQPTLLAKGNVEE